MAEAKQPSSDDLEILQDINDNFIRAVSESDAGWFDQNLTNDFLNSNPDGSLSDRAQFLVQMAKPCNVAGLRVEDVCIRIRNDIAIIHGKTKYQKSDGQPGAGRYTDVYVREQGRWLCAAAHVTRG